MRTFTPSRRMLVAAAAVAAVALSWPIHATQSPQTAASAPQIRRFVIDSHQHWRPGPEYMDTLVRTYRARNAMACVLTPVSGLNAVREAAAQYPDVVIPYGHIDVDNPDAPAHIAAFANAGFKGIKMHRPKHNWDDFGYFPIYQRLQDLGLVALFHTGIVSGSSDDPEPSSMARMRPAYLHTIARSFPTLRIQGAHLGNPWYDEAGEVARWEKNVYFDLTGSSLIKKARNLAVFGEYLWWEGPTAHSSPDAVYAFEKLVFGTDEPPGELDNMLSRYEAMLDANDVPEASRRKIYGETMARILDIEVKP
jgi:predicted TIM-barrel fold metal-dependent hydrolase